MAAITKKAYQLSAPLFRVNSFDTKTKVPPKPTNTPNIFSHLNGELKKSTPKIKVKRGVIPFKTAATALAIAVSAKANK